MKLSEMFIGQIVMMVEKSDCRDSRIPEVGKVVDIALEYDVSILIGSSSTDKFRVLPVVHFVGESTPRKVSPHNLMKYKE